jgi:hypothetical protein
MKLRRQLEGGLLALMLSAGLAASCVAQRQDRPANTNRPPRATAPAAPRQPARQEARQQNQEQRRNQAAAPRNDRPYNAGAANANRPATNPNRPSASDFNRQGVNPNRPPNASISRGGENSGAYRGNQNRLSPEERQRVLQNQQRFKQLSPQQQQDMRARSRVWQQMTPQQRDHIKNEVLPAWKSLPPQRQKAISQRLGVLQNMPESARNQHLSDPNFTRGMSDQDRATLRDLSHLHVGGAPDPPNE